MNQLEAIWNQARLDLVVVTEQGEEDVFLWEHSARTARAAEMIAQLPVVSDASPDETAIIAAALYHDSGWISGLREGDVSREDVLLRPATEAQREQSAVYLEASLLKLLPVETLRRASVAVRSLGARSIDSLEGQVVAEAENLEEFGLLSLWPAIRRGLLEGKGVQAVIDTWHRRKEYQFWLARLSDSFRFEAVRAIAERRLAEYERAMRELESHHRADDICVALSPQRSGQVPWLAGRK